MSFALCEYERISKRLGRRLLQPNVVPVRAKHAKHNSVSQMRITDVCKLTAGGGTGKESGTVGFTPAQAFRSSLLGRRPHYRSTAPRSPRIHTFARKLDGKTGAAPLMYIYPRSLRGQSGMAPLRLTNAIWYNIWLVFPPFIAVNQTLNTHPDPWKTSLKWKRQTWLSLMVFSIILDVNPDGMCGMKMLHVYRCHWYLNTLVLLWRLT